MSTKKYVSLDKLELYDEKIKKYLGDADTVVLNSAKDYADKLADNYEPSGAAATAQQEATKASNQYTDEQIAALTTGTGAVKANADAIDKIKDGESIDSFADVEAALAGKQAAGDYATKSEVGTIPVGEDGQKVASSAIGYADYLNTAMDARVDALEAIEHHTHSNKDVLDDITSAKVDAWDNAESNAKAHADGVKDDVLKYVGTIPNDSEGNAVAASVIAYVDKKTAGIATEGAMDILSDKVDTLIGSDANKSVRTIANEELAAQLIGENAKESLDTLAEIATWIQSHPDDAAAMNRDIDTLKQKVVLGTYVDGEETKEYATVKAYVEAEVAEINAKLDGIEDSADANIIETVKVNGAALTPDANKAVDITVPTGALASKNAVSESDLDTALATKLNGMTDANELAKAISDDRALIDIELNKKVDKVTGKGLSTNDLTDELKGNYDTAYTHSQAAHAPANAQANIIESVKVNGTALTITDKAVNISVPTDNSQLANGAGYLVANDIANKADKATTLAGYGIADAYTTTQTDTAIANAMATFVECSETEIAALFQ